MIVTKTLDNDRLIVAVDGRLDTLTAPELQKELLPALKGVRTLEFDMSNLVYISSAGLRALMILLQAMDGENGKIRVLNANEAVKEIFEITGLTDVLGVE